MINHWWEEEKNTAAYLVQRTSNCFNLVSLFVFISFSPMSATLPRSQRLSLCLLDPHLSVLYSSFINHSYMSLSLVCFPSLSLPHPPLQHLPDNEPVSLSFYFILFFLLIRPVAAVLIVAVVGNEWLGAHEKRSDTHTHAHTHTYTDTHRHTQTDKLNPAPSLKQIGDCGVVTGDGAGLVCRWHCRWPFVCHRSPANQIHYACRQWDWYTDIW